MEPITAALLWGGATLLGGALLQKKKPEDASGMMVKGQSYQLYMIVDPSKLGIEPTEQNVRAAISQGLSAAGFKTFPEGVQYWMRPGGTAGLKAGSITLQAKGNYQGSNPSVADFARVVSPAVSSLLPAPLPVA